MASAAKTTKLFLPQWTTAEKPERTDFNAAFLAIEAVFLKVYPVGSIYLSVVNTNPGDFFGGTWVAFGQGRTLVGLSGADPEFDTLEETFGTKTHTLTVAEMPFHRHPIAFGSSANMGYNSARGNDYGPDGIHFVNTEGAGGDAGHNNIQPSIVVRMWKRTA